MNTRECTHNDVAATHELKAGDIASFNAERGMVIRCLQGQAWITQEGDLNDYFVATDTRFHSSSNGIIVVNALNERTRIAVERVAPKPCGDWRRSGVRLEPGFAERAQQRARQARALMMRALSLHLRVLLRRAWRHASNMVSRAGLALRVRSTLHS